MTPNCFLCLTPLKWLFVDGCLLLVPYVLGSYIKSDELKPLKVTLTYIYCGENSFVQMRQKYGFIAMNYTNWSLSVLEYFVYNNDLFLLWHVNFSFRLILIYVCHNGPIFSITELISSITKAFTLSSTGASSGVWENVNVYNKWCCYRKFYSL